LQRNAKIGLVLETPMTEFKEVAEKLEAYTTADFKKLAKVKAPTLGIKYTLEAVRRLIERGFKPSN
jgi:predicted secreted protein